LPASKPGLSAGTRDLRRGSRVRRGGVNGAAECLGSRTWRPRTGPHPMTVVRSRSPSRAA